MALADDMSFQLTAKTIMPRPTLTATALSTLSTLISETKHPSADEDARSSETYLTAASEQYATAQEESCSGDCHEQLHSHHLEFGLDHRADIPTLSDQY